LLRTDIHRIALAIRSSLEGFLLYWFLKSVIAEPLFSIWWRPWIEGKENLPATGAAIMIANHPAEGETVLLPAMLKRRLVFTPNTGLYTQTGFKGRLLAWFLQAIRMVPLDRSGGKASADGMELIAEELRSGEIVVLFPEGTRSADGRLYRGRTGAARMALRERVPVIPVAVFDTKTEKNRLGIPRLRRPGIRIGKPMDFSDYHAAGNDRDTLRWVTDQMMAAVMDLSGQTYVDIYSSAYKASLRRGNPIDAPILERPGSGRPAPPLPPGSDSEAA
jgi:1-acyl-sn-glycerol-3-phosphate acyltransferase